MAFKLLVVLAIFNVVLSDPLPDPDPNIEINVLQKVETSCCPGDCCGGCVFDGETYPDKAVYTGACVALVCNKGVWEMLPGYINNACGWCEVEEEPRIYPYDIHEISWSYSRPYDVFIHGTFVLSQQWRSPVPSDLSVYGNFRPCEGIKTISCVLRLYYKQFGLEVEVNIPGKKVRAKEGSGSYVEVNDKIRSFSGSFGTVLIFISSPDQSNIYIVGSKGFTVALDVWNNDLDDQDYAIKIYAMPHLENQLYGLCDIYTNGTAFDFTLQNGSVITDWNNKEQYFESWEV